MCVQLPVDTGAGRDERDKEHPLRESCGCRPHFLCKRAPRCILKCLSMVAGYFPEDLYTGLTVYLPGVPAGEQLVAQVFCEGISW